MTAVGRRWRGRGVATTLKRATIAWAIEPGLELLETGNDDDNAPMRAVNRKLGYRPIPDMLTFRGPLRAGALRPRPIDGAYFGPWRRSTSTASGFATGSSRRASLLGYGASKRRLILYGLCPIAQWVPLERFGAVTTRTMTLEPREGHFTLREDWRVSEFPAMLRLYGRALRRVDAGWLNAFGWSNIGIERYFDEYFPRTGAAQPDRLGRRLLGRRDRAPGRDRQRAGEAGRDRGDRAQRLVPQRQLPVRHHPRGEPRAGRPASRHPVILKVSPDEDYVGQARMAERYGSPGSPRSTPSRACGSTRRPASRGMKNRYGGMSGRAIKPIGLRVVSELREAGIRLPIIANGGIRDFDDCREYFWAGADAVSLGSAVWLRPMPLYALGPLEGLRIRRLISRVAAFTPPEAAPHGGRRPTRRRRGRGGRGRRPGAQSRRRHRGRGLVTAGRRALASDGIMVP